MGRSKFPGKPSKHVNRKRINVLPPAQNTTAVVDCNSPEANETDEESKQVNTTCLFTLFIRSCSQCW